MIKFTVHLGDPLVKLIVLRNLLMAYCRHNVVTNCSFLWEKVNEEQKMELNLRFPQLNIKLSDELDFKTRAVGMRQRVHLVHGNMDTRWCKGISLRQAPDLVFYQHVVWGLYLDLMILYSTIRKP